MKRVAFLTTIFPMKEEYLIDFFDSLRSQTLQNFDVIVVNDGYENFKKIHDKYQDLSIIELPYSNTIAKNREYGINFVVDKEYDILIFGDSDDYFTTERVEKSIKLLESCDIVVNDLSLFNHGGVYCRRYISHRVANRTVINFDFIKDKNIFGLSNTAVKVNILNKVFFDEDLVAVDWFIYKKLLKSGCVALFTNEIETYYRQYADNTLGLSITDGIFPLWWEKIDKLEEKIDMKVDITIQKKVFNFGSPYVIAELGANHNGDMKLAKKLIIEAKEAGADCVKFQSWTKDSIFAKKKYDDNFFIADDYRDRVDYTLEEIVDEYSISEDELLEMKNLSDEVGIDCTSTPFSKKEADFVVDKLHTPFIKVASMDLNNYPFLEYLAKKGKPMIISTGLSELYEIDKAVKTIEDAGNNQIVILHCVSTYPPNDKDINLNNIKTIMAAYPNYPVGFSDHTIGTAIPLASVALGACVIEKHFTLDKNMEGWDHKVSATKDELEVIVSGAKRIVESLGSFRVTATESSEKKREFRRSVVITRDMKQGEKIQASDLDYKRPGGGFDPEMTSFLIGRTINKDLDFDHILTKTDIV